MNATGEITQVRCNKCGALLTPSNEGAQVRMMAKARAGTLHQWHRAIEASRLAKTGE